MFRDFTRERAFWDDVEGVGDVDWGMSALRLRGGLLEHDTNRIPAAHADPR
jgi:hypothetical protein